MNSICKYLQNNSKTLPFIYSGSRDLFVKRGAMIATGSFSPPSEILWLKEVRPGQRRAGA